MKIAVASQNQKAITGHIGHCRRFWLYEIADKTIQSKTLLELSAEQSFHNSSPDAPHPLDDVQVLISGGLGKNLARRLERKGIDVVVTQETDIEKAITAYLEGTLIREKAECNGHDDEHHHEHRHQHRHRHQHCHSQSVAQS
jgi:predicted Fe-Mo cluster-binding NifX family protein